MSSEERTRRPASTPDDDGAGHGEAAAEVGWDFHVAYRVADKDWAEWIAWQLFDAGYTVNFDAWNVVAGSDVVYHLELALRRARHVLVVLAAADATGAADTRHWGAAYSNDVNTGLRRLVPVRVEDQAPPGPLAARRSIDLFGLDEVEARQRLVAEVEGVVQGPTVPASSPRFPGREASTVSPRFPGRSAGRPDSPGPPRDIGLGRSTDTARPAGYLNFDVVVEPVVSTAGDDVPLEDRRYRARVLAGPGGEATVEFGAPFSEPELERIMHSLGTPRRLPVRRLSRADADVHLFGEALFRAVFRNGARDALASALERTTNQGLGLRLRLRLTACPELSALPWEYLHSPVTQGFFALSEWTPIVRYLELPKPAVLARPPVDIPMQVLVQTSSPAEVTPVDSEAEVGALRTSLAKLEQSGAVKVTRTASGSLEDLQVALQHGNFHVYHFIGHGAESESNPGGSLLYEGERGAARWVDGRQLAPLLANHRSLRLVLLNACEGARGDLSDPLGGVAQGLIRSGVPAVVAMQFEISEEAALAFARHFYGAVSVGFSLEAAVAEGRKAILRLDRVEWGTPVLHLRAPQDAVFDVGHRGGAVPSGVTRSPVAALAEPLRVPSPSTELAPGAPRRRAAVGAVAVAAAVTVALLIGLVVAPGLPDGEGTGGGAGVVASQSLGVEVVGAVVDNRTVPLSGDEPAVVVVDGFATRSSHYVAWVVAGPLDAGRVRAVVAVFRDDRPSAAEVVVLPRVTQSSVAGGRTTWRASLEDTVVEYPPDEVARFEITLLSLTSLADAEALDSYRPLPLPSELAARAATQRVHTVVVELR